MCIKNVTIFESFKLMFFVFFHSPKWGKTAFNIYKRHLFSVSLHFSFFFNIKEYVPPCRRLKKRLKIYFFADFLLNFLMSCDIVKKPH